MTPKDFAASMLRLRLPQFSGTGAITQKKTVTYPPYSGRMFLGATLVGKKQNKRLVFTNTPY